MVKTWAIRKKAPAQHTQSIAIRFDLYMSVYLVLWFAARLVGSICARNYKRQTGDFETQHGIIRR